MDSSKKINWDQKKKNDNTQFDAHLQKRHLGETSSLANNPEDAPIQKTNITLKQDNSDTNDETILANDPMYFNVSLIDSTDSATNINDIEKNNETQIASQNLNFEMNMALLRRENNGPLLKIRKAPTEEEKKEESLAELILEKTGIPKPLHKKKP